MHIVIKLTHVDNMMAWFGIFDHPGSEESNGTRTFVYFENAHESNVQVVLSLKGDELIYSSSISLIQAPFATRVVKVGLGLPIDSPLSRLDEARVMQQPGLIFDRLPGWYDPDKDRLIELTRQIADHGDCAYTTSDVKTVTALAASIVKISPTIRPSFVLSGPKHEEEIRLDLVLPKGTSAALVCMAARFGIVKLVINEA